MIVKRIGVASAARIYGAITAGFGLVIGVIVAMASALGAGLAEAGEGAFVGTVLGVGAIILLPIMYGVFGLIAGAIGALLYNLFAGMVGGVQLDVE